MHLKLLFLAVLICTTNLFFSQEREMKIDTVVLFDNQLNRQNNFHLLKKISPEDIQKNATNLSEVLRFQTPVYIKENGRGAVSSPSFRGTTAQQTAFLWNGISINSVFLGQGDINNIGFLLADELGVKSGGGSVLYGSGAIGGSIHLNNQLNFGKGLKNSLYSEIASYGTFQHILKSSFSNDGFSVQLSANHSISENNFEIPERDYYNRNGKYSNGSVNFGMAYKINPTHKISWISECYRGNQRYPIFSENQNKTQYLTENFKSLGVWDWQGNNFNNHLRLAFTKEEFQYYQSENMAQSSGGKSSNYIVKNDFEYRINSLLNINVLAGFQQNNAEGYLSGIKDVQRHVFSGAVLLKYQPLEELILEAGIKKDAVQSISSPWLYSFSGKWKVNNFQTAFSWSKNFRYPSFNDLYWQPGGNLDLKPETSQQYEWKNQWQNKYWTLAFTPYWMEIQDMIRWLPTSEGYWKAFNTNKVQSYGVETQLAFQQKFGNHSWKSSVGYTYTKSVNKENNTQLQYVPFHKVFGVLQYQYKNAKIYLQGMFNGKTYTDSMMKELDALQPYIVLNTGVEFTFEKHFTLGAKVNNLTNQFYETTAYYFMPPRNYAATIKINF